MRTETCQRMHAHGSSTSSLTWRKFVIVFLRLRNSRAVPIFLLLLRLFCILLSFSTQIQGWHVRSGLDWPLAKVWYQLSEARGLRHRCTSLWWIVDQLRFCSAGRGQVDLISQVQQNQEGVETTNNDRKTSWIWRAHLFLLLFFHSTISGYDFGYLLKILTCSPLPAEEGDFFDLLRTYFPCIYDIKYLMKSCKNLKGGLQELANDLQVRSPATN